MARPNMRWIVSSIAFTGGLVFLHTWFSASSRPAGARFAESLLWGLVGGVLGLGVSLLFAIGDKKADTKVSRVADGSPGSSRWIDWAIHLTAYTMIAVAFFPGILGLDLAPATAVLVGGLVILVLLTAIKGSVSRRSPRD